MQTSTEIYIEFRYSNFIHICKSIILSLDAVVLQFIRKIKHWERANQRFYCSQYFYFAFLLTCIEISQV